MQQMNKPTGPITEAGKVRAVLTKDSLKAGQLAKLALISVCAILTVSCSLSSNADSAKGGSATMLNNIAYAERLMEFEHNDGASWPTSTVQLKQSGSE